MGALFAEWRRSLTMQIEVFTEGSSFGRLASEWGVLLARSATDTIFLTPAFQDVWWRVFGREETLHLVAVRDGDGKLIGLAPLYHCSGDDGRDQCG